MLLLPVPLCSVGLAPPSIEVRYKDLCVETTALVGSKQIPTVARTLSQSFKASRRGAWVCVLRGAGGAAALGSVPVGMLSGTAPTFAPGGSRLCSTAPPSFLNSRAT